MAKGPQAAGPRTPARTTPTSNKSSGGGISRTLFILSAVFVGIAALVAVLDESVLLSGIRAVKGVAAPAAPPAHSSPSSTWKAPPATPAPVAKPEADTDADVSPSGDSPLYYTALQGQNPVARDSSVVLSENGVARFTVLTSQLIRMEYARDGVFEDAATFSFINRHLPSVEFTTEVKTGATGQKLLTIDTEHLHLAYAYAPNLGPAPTLTGAGETAEQKKNFAPGFSERSLLVRIKKNGSSDDYTEWRPGMTNEGRLMGTIRTLDNSREANSLDCDELPPMLQYGKVAQLCQYGLISRSGWALVDDTFRPRFDDDPDWPWVQDPPSRPYAMEGDRIAARFDWYMFGHGLDYRAALGDFIKVSGRIGLPPKHAFGIYFSRWWPFSDVEVFDIIKEYNAYAIPLDISVQDMDWHMTNYAAQDRGETDLAGQPKGWTGHSWDHKYFPDPEGFFKWCRSRGIRNSFNLHLSAGVQPHETGYPGMARAMGVDPASEDYIPFNIVNKTYATAYYTHLLKPILDAGLDHFWLDWQQGEDWFSSRPGYSLPNAVSPTWYLNYVFSTFPDHHRDGRRPVILHRWGGLGGHRYQVGFSGDVYPSFETYNYQPYFTASAANVGFGYWSHDIGGFMLPAGGELYTRWIQFGVLSPIFRTHGSRLAENIKRVWFNDQEWFPAMRDAMQFRSKLLPYIYTAARRSYDTGISMVFPLYYNWPEADEAYEFKTQYMFGEDMMSVPVNKKMVKSMRMARDVEVWMPPGEWIDFHTGQVEHGPAVFNRSFTIREHGLYVKSGSIIVTKLIGDEDIQDNALETKGREWLGRAQDIPRTLEAQVFLPLSYSGDSFTSDNYHYEDDGDTQGHIGSEYQWTRFSYTLSEDSLEFTVHAAEGSHPKAHASRSYLLRLRGCVPPASVTVNGEPIPELSYVTVDEKRDANGWYFDGAAMSTVVSLFKRFDVTKPIVVKLGLPVGLQAELRPLMAGAPGRIARARVLKHELLDNQYPHLYPEHYDQVSLLSEVGIMASYNSSDLQSLLQGFQARLQAAITQVKALTRVKSSVKKTAKAFLTRK